MWHDDDNLWNDYNEIDDMEQYEREQLRLDMKYDRESDEYENETNEERYNRLPEEI